MAINYPPPAFGWRSALSFKKGASYGALSFGKLQDAYLYKKKFRFPPAKQKALHSLEPKACRPMSLGSYRPANLLIRTDSKHSLRLFDMSFFLVTRLLNARTCLFRTDSKQSLRPFVFI